MANTTESNLINRRAILKSGAAVGVGALLGAGVSSQFRDIDTPESSLHGADRIPFYGTHQAGIETPAAAYVSFIAFDLNKGVDKSSLVRLMRLLTDSAARLTQGEAALADTEPELAK